MLIDSHQHVGYLRHNTQAVVDEMDRLGIDQAWLLTWYLPRHEDDPGYHVGCDPLFVRADGTHTAMPLSNLLDACRQFPTWFVPGYCPCPTEGPDAAALFEAAYHMHGVRVCGEWSYRCMLDDPRALNLFRKAGQLQCPVVLHIDVPYLPDGRGGQVYCDRWYGGPIDALERALAACPQTIFIGHAPGFWRYISGDEYQSSDARPAGPVTPGGRIVRMLEQYPNLHADLSAGSGLNAMRRDAGFAYDFIIRWSDRLLYGRDQYGHDHFHFLKTLNLPQEIQDKLFFKNAQRLMAAAETTAAATVTAAAATAAVAKQQARVE